MSKLVNVYVSKIINIIYMLADEENAQLDS